MSHPFFTEFLVGTDQADILLGTNLGVMIRGRQGDDYITGGEDNDLLIGNRGNDTLIGEDGLDVLRGGRGHDTFVFPQDGSVDIVADFTHKDSILVMGAEADQLVYDRAAGLLYLDGAPIAAFDGHPTISSADFLFV